MLELEFTAGFPSTKWCLCILTFTWGCYGWVALALPVYANVSWDPERPLNKPAHTGRASATQPEAEYLIRKTKLPANHLVLAPNGFSAC